MALERCFDLRRYCLKLDDLQTIIGQKCFSPANCLLFIAFDIHLHHRRPMKADQTIQSLYLNWPEIVLAGHRDAIPRIETTREHHFPVSITKGDFANDDSFLQAVDLDISPQSQSGYRVWLEGPNRCMSKAGSQDRVASNVRTDVQEMIGFTQKMQKNHHIGEFMQPRVDIACGSFHATAYSKTLTSNPRNYHFILKAASDLP